MNLQIDPRITQSTPSVTQQSRPDQAKDLQQLRQSTREMEAMYVFEAYKAMRKNVPENGLFEKSFATKTFQEMLDKEMARTTAAGDGMGLGQAMFDQLKGYVR